MFIKRHLVTAVNLYCQILLHFSTFILAPVQTGVRSSPVSVDPPSSPSTRSAKATTTSSGSNHNLCPTDDTLLTQKSTLVWTFELLNPLIAIANQQLTFGCFSLAKASVTFAAIFFLSMTIMIESIVWSYVTNNMSPDEIMDDNFCKFSFL